MPKWNWTKTSAVVAHLCESSPSGSRWLSGFWKQTCRLIPQCYEDCKAYVVAIVEKKRFGSRQR